jgi:hypothetical protein
LLAEKTVGDLNKLKEIQNQTNQLTEYIDELKSDLIKFCTADLELSPTDNEHSILKQIPDQTDFRKPSMFMCGIESNGKAYELKSKLSEYKSYIKNLVNDREITERIDKLIDLDVPADSNPGFAGWEEYYFRDVILITSLDILTNYQLRIKLVESELLQNMIDNSRSGKTEHVATLINQ